MSVTIAFLVGAAFFGLVVASAAGLFRGRLVVGPPRLASNDSLATLGIIMAMMIACWALPPVVYGSWKQSKSPTAPPTTKPGTASETPPQFTESEQIVLEAVSGLTLLLGGVAMTRWYRPSGISSLGLNLSRIGPGVLVGAIAILPVFPWMLCVNVGVEKLWDALHWQHAMEHPTLQFLGESNAQALRILAIVAAVLIAPLSEELLFRGYLQTILLALLDRAQRRAAARWGAIVIASLAFAAMHPWWMRPSIFFLSLGLGYVYERTGNLWASATLHALFNGSMVAIFLWQGAHG